MAIHYNSKIVTNGLTFVYDSDNVKTGNNKELISRSTGTVNTNEIQFLPNTLMETMWSSSTTTVGSAPAPGTGFTMNMWTKRTATTNGDWEEICLIEWNRRCMWVGYSFNATSVFHCSFPYFDSSNNFTYWNIDPTFTNAGITQQIGIWYNLCLTYNNATRITSSYINGIFAVSGTRPGTGDLLRPVDNLSVPAIRIFGGASSTAFENHRSGSFHFYNRPLSNTEIVQNFNALRGRYGV